MEFKNLKSDSDCDCTNDSYSENTEEIFCRRLYTNPPTAICFQSVWERGQRPRKKDNCKDVCKYKAVSIQKFIDLETLLETYRITMKFSKRRLDTPFFCLFKFKKNSGLIKATPSQNDKKHYSFFKADTFSIEYIEVIEINRIANV